MPTFTAAQIAQQLDAELVGDGSVQLTGFAPADRAQDGHLTFAENEEYLAKAEQGGASAILAGANATSSIKTLLRVKSPRVAFAKVLPLFFPEPQFPPGIHPSAIVAPSSQIDPTVHIGPYCVIGERVKIGARSALLGGNHIGDDVHLGDDARVFPNVAIYARSQIGHRVRIHAGAVIGSDGYGYVFDAGQHLKVLQIGNVIIHDDVEIGANVCIDRAALGSTVIGRGTKIDNLVQVAHNVVVGEGCLLVAQAGIAGSSELGNFVVAGGQAGIVGHLKVGNHVMIAAKSGVMKNIPDGEKWMGTPAGPDIEAKRQHIALRRLPDLLRRFARLEKKFIELAGDTPKT
ncbi:MAG TPA: UDP-3-O-(3-hydroxymyristoyl)glucosamine N-acyltransferase [Candidatus Limnocylindria bacterium]|nr:UDP-3-O-(3-hydroxymyristoyl)glucosamine N-acyltransferase [Candidatus Limnocylindria bacterium]